MKADGSKHGFLIDLQFVVGALDLSVDMVLRKAGVPLAMVGSRSSGSMPPDLYFRIWNACHDLYPGDDFALRLGQAMAQVPFTPAIFSVYCSKTVGSGLARLAIFKPLVGPLRYNLEMRGDDLLIGLEPVDRAIEIPASLVLFDVVFLTTLLRATTATQLTPLKVTAAKDDPRVSAFVGCRIDPGPAMTLLFSAEDVARPLVTRNAAMWQIFEPHLRVALADELLDASIEVRVRNALLESLPAGGANVATVAAQMGLSSRSLQRRLSEAGISFSGLLDETRTRLAKRYLAATGLSTQEISYLLGYADPSSFFRAFRVSTGRTPLDFREAAVSAGAYKERI